MTTTNISSHGRGGAGNIQKSPPSSLPPKPTPEDLITPTLKSEHYTTGRGGTGNMARNDPNFPEIARASQDVEPVAHREHDGPHHYGRGGAANVARAQGPPNSEERKRRESGSAGEKGLVDKGKEFLGKLGRK
ncbi:hypothetical protein DM02DRAFT_536184 [Periconia macrospinosa]|uniref:Uncharacterized protein n=1 Tax=Periconia macrospinosa TaxID=97972 RepID=A0A2V1DD86_9PLEO|nr:hypothetical protein DM02DRAFT_536184 [Periconia macrospinosa]